MFGIRSDALWVSALLLNLMMVFGIRSTVESDKAPLQAAKTQISSLKQELERTQLQTAVLNAQIEDDRAYVVPLIPEVQKKWKQGDPEEYQLRSLASSLKQSTEEIRIERGSSLIAKAKKAFVQERYDETISMLTRLIQMYPSSVHSLEAHYLLAESLFRVKKTEAALLVAESMIRLYPTSELTGFVMIEVGKALEARERPEDAIEVYSSVLNHFEQSQLRQLALVRKRGLE